MAGTIVRFFSFGMLARGLGFCLDMILIYVAAELFARAYYLMSAVPILLLSISSYVSSISPYSDWMRRALGNDNTLYLVLLTYLLAVAYLAVDLVNGAELTFTAFVSLMLAALFAVVISVKYAVGTRSAVWLFPASGCLALVVGMIGALLLPDEAYVFFIVIFMTIIRPIVFVLFGEMSTNEASGVETLNTSSLLLLISFGLRHFVLVGLRYLVPESEVIAYSFNSRIIQSIYAFSLLPALIHSVQFFPQSWKKSLYFCLSLIACCLVGVFFVRDIVIFQIHLTWLLVMVMLGVGIFFIDMYVMKYGGRAPVVGFALQVFASSVVGLSILSYWS